MVAIMEQFMSNLMKTNNNEELFEIVNDNAKLPPTWSKTKVRRTKSFPVGGYGSCNNKTCRWNNCSSSGGTNCKGRNNNNITTSNDNKDTLFTIVRPRSTYSTHHPSLTRTTSSSSTTTTPPAPPPNTNTKTNTTTQSTATETATKTSTMTPNEFQAQQQRTLIPSGDNVGMQLIDVIQKLSLKAAVALTNDHLHNKKMLSQG